MAEFLGDWKRTGLCASYNENDIGKEVVLMGWTAVRRNLGALIFIDLRDRSGIIQLVFDESTYKGDYTAVESIRSEFTANVSHELKTPLTSISGFAELMKSGGVPEETVVDFSNSIYTEAQRLISLVTDIIKISELDERNEHFVAEKVDLYELSKEIIKSLRHRGSRTGRLRSFNRKQVRPHETRRQLYSDRGNEGESKRNQGKEGDGLKTGQKLPPFPFIIFIKERW